MDMTTSIGYFRTTLALEVVGNNPALKNPRPSLQTKVVRRPIPFPNGHESEGSSIGSGSSTRKDILMRRRGATTSKFVTPDCCNRACEGNRKGFVDNAMKENQRLHKDGATVGEKAHG